MKVLLTGASGFVGRHLLARLVRAGAEVHAVGRTPPTPLPGCYWHTLDLLDAAPRYALLQDLKPTHLIHLAWTTAHGHYWHDPRNHDWVLASLALLDEFAAVGGEHALFAGTCAEDDWRKPTQPPSGGCTAATRYGRSKAALRLLALDRAEQLGLPLAWGRIYFPFGPGEQPQRLVPSLSRQLLAGLPAATGPGTLERDFVYVGDLAAMMMLVSERRHAGALDLSTGRATPIGTLAAELAELAQRPDLLRVGALPAREGDPQRLVGSDDVLRSLGWHAEIGLSEGLRHTLAWWRAQHQGSVHENQ
ncbi:MAG: NAD(P)-dependent oxidoreductase [Aquabacterium sp.]|jgi:nucleoside-diphosphate-sugar epimerase|uniref:NAD-dependent epimerase/dehydratase family protein n=1 Tax=Aquabacterium sp. TaxID=1872578 RepID=UPI002A36B6D0|nr:NAD(P)-dependent oxidoreductase [Aquabacterium sp.]MDX9845044.1 NAD(P)-dependent oxidoreductase [Aquabacterium sp.]